MSYFRWDGSGAATASGTVFTTVTGNLSFTDDDVRAVYIDWDDGTSNKKIESNYQWVETTEPTGSMNPEHTYTASGTFSPVIQVVNSKGFFSKYYSNESSNSDVSPFAQTTTMEDIDIADTNATGIMKIENRTLKSGIDNSILDVEGPKELYIAVAPTLSVEELAYLCESGSAEGVGETQTGKVMIDIECVLDYGLRDGDAASSSSYLTNTGGERIVKVLSVVLSGANLTGSVTGLRNVLANGAHNLGALESGAQVAQVLSMTYKNPKFMGSTSDSGVTGGVARSKYLKNDAYNRFKVFLLAKSNALSGKSPRATTTALYVPLAYITAGDPIKKASAPLRNYTLDFSQSRAAASNVALSNYRYDLGKGAFQSANSWSTIGSSTAVAGAFSLVGTSNLFSDKTVQTSPTKSSAYTYMPRPDGMKELNAYNVFTTSLPWDTNAASATIEDQLVLDDYGRFFPQYHLSRLSTTPASDGFTDATCDTTSGSTSITHVANAKIVAGLSVKGPGIPDGAYIVSITNSTTFVIGGTYEGAIVTTTNVDSLTFGGNTVSTISDNKPAVFRITPAVSWTGSSAANSRVYPTKVQTSGTNNSASKEYTNQVFANNIAGRCEETNGTYVPSYTNQTSCEAGSKKWRPQGVLNLSGMNAMTFTDVNDDTRSAAAEYILMMFDKKTNKIFMNMSPYADNMQSTLGTEPAWNIAGVYYMSIEEKGTPRMNCEWIPLEFEDTTAVTKEYKDDSNNKYVNIKASLSKSGYISFDMPLDWESIDITGACGGVFSSTATPTETGSYDYGLMTLATAGYGAGTTIGDYNVYDITAATDVPSISGQTAADIGSFKYIFIPTLPTTQTGTAYWVSADGDDGYDTGNVIINLGDSGSYNGGTDEYNTALITEGLIRRVNIYNILDGFSKAYRLYGGSATELFNVDSAEGDSTADAWPNTYCITSGSTIGDNLATAWADEKYLLKIVLSGTVADTTTIFPEIWNIFDATRGYSKVVKEIDNSAYNLNSLAITSDIAVTRAGNYYQAITRKGKVFIARVGTPIQSIGFESVALGDESSATAFEDYGDPAALYGHLHKLRKIQADNVRVYWDEPQKDGSYVRFWGMITEVSETHGTGGPRSIINYSCNMVVEEIALLDENCTLMTGVFPLGSIEDDRSYT